MRWPGRGERLENVILDCAHNPHALRALGRWIRAENLGPIHTIFGVMDGKDAAEMARQVESWSSSIVLVTPDYPRRLPATELAKHFSEGRAQVVAEVGRALRERPMDRITLVCGSGFLVGEARALLQGQPYPECGLRTTAR